MREQKRSSKRQTHMTSQLPENPRYEQQPRTTPLELRVLVANVRSIQTEKKMLGLKSKVLDNQQLGANVLLLSETHLKRQF